MREVILVFQTMSHSCRIIDGKPMGLLVAHKSKGKAIQDKRRLKKSYKYVRILPSTEADQEFFPDAKWSVYVTN